MALARCFILTDVTTRSQAPGFTITTASSAGPRPITDHVSAWLRTDERRLFEELFTG